MQSLNLYQQLEADLKKLNLLGISKENIEKIIEYLDLLEKWNKVHNLTSIKNKQEMLTHHVLDSLVAYPHIKNIKSILDVGTGAGIPGIILAIVMPETKFTLLDSNKKKLKFVQHAITCLKLKNVEVIGNRIESFKPQQKFQMVVSRAFSSLNNFLLAAHIACDESGTFVAYKGIKPDFIQDPLPEGFQLQEVIEVDVPRLNKERCLVFVTNKAT